MQIAKFIKDNKISFARGNRNTSVTILIGYALHLGISKKALETELAGKISRDKFIKEEVDRLWNYCRDNNYGAYWKKPGAKKEWIF